MPRLGIAAVAATFALYAFTSSVAANHYAYDLDCWQFASQAEAQATYAHILTTDGWAWMYLDGDGDGIACELW
jgi:hypothetical protein